MKQQLPIRHSELLMIRELHKKWRNNDTDGIRANLVGENLHNANLRGADLRLADLRLADLSKACLSGANLENANLAGANLTNADFSGAHMRGVDLTKADLRGANLRGADLRDATLIGAVIEDADLSDYTSGVTKLCPEGSFIAWKKLKDDTIAKLLIPEHAKRSNATSLKCRASEAEVLQILKLKNGRWEECEVGFSKYDTSFMYEVGQTVKVDNFDEDRWNECSTGIHFFIDRQIAENY